MRRRPHAHANAGHSNGAASSNAYAKAHSDRNTPADDHADPDHLGDGNSYGDGDAPAGRCHDNRSSDGDIGETSRAQGQHRVSREYGWR